MLREVSYIELSGEKLPMKMDNIVLQQVQEIYGSVKAFELLLMGWEEKKDEDGGVYVAKAKEPSIAVANHVLPKMVIEGYAVLGQEAPYTELEIVRMIDKSYLVIAQEVHNEMMRCFKTKKQLPNQKMKKKTESRSNLIGYILSALREWALQKHK